MEAETPCRATGSFRQWECYMALAGDFSAVMGRGSGSFIIWTQIGLQGGKWQTRLCRPNGAMAGGRRMASTRVPCLPCLPCRDHAFRKNTSTPHIAKVGDRRRVGDLG